MTGKLIVAGTLLTVVCLWTASAENLLRNPGFETVEHDLPAHWDRYVMSQQGAIARCDYAHWRQGNYSVLIHNPEPYSTEPANNWSQPVIERLGGKTVELSGYIRTDDATEAALWLQCWTERPLRLVDAATTSQTTPVYGTRDWTRVHLEATVPEAADFIMVRCVLLGRGTAWYDDIALAVVEEETNKGTASNENGDGAANLSESVDEDDPSGSAETQDSTSPADTMKQPAPGSPMVSGAPGDTADAETQNMAADSAPALTRPHESAISGADLFEAQRAMIETNRVLRDTNELLVQELYALRQELRDLRRQVEEAATTPALPKPTETGDNEGQSAAPPILVPQGLDWRQLIREAERAGP